MYFLLSIFKNYKFFFSKLSLFFIFGFILFFFLVINIPINNESSNPNSVNLSKYDNTNKRNIKTNNTNKTKTIHTSTSDSNINNEVKIILFFHTILKINLNKTLTSFQVKIIIQKENIPHTTLNKSHSKNTNQILH